MELADVPRINTANKYQLRLNFELTIMTDALATLSPFTSAAPALVAQGYSPLPIAPGAKFPGSLGLDGEPRAMRGWDRFCKKPVPPNIIAGWSRLRAAGVGVALGRGLIAVDIDRDDMVDAILAVLPPSPVMKVGRKGITAFFREGSTPVASRNFHGFLDLLSTGKQTVLPPSRHPSGIDYAWATERTLLDMPLSELPEFPVAGIEIIESVLVRFGWDPKPVKIERASSPAGFAPLAPGGDFGGNLNDLNNAALANLDAWVPHLGLPKTYPQSGGWRAVPRWRPSSTGKSEAARDSNLGFHSSGIKDFVNEQGYRPLQVVEKVFVGLDRHDAARWLAERIGYSLPEAEPIIELVAGSKAPSRRGEVAPPEMPERRPLAEVKASLASAFDEFASRTVVEHRHKRAAYDEAIAAYDEAIAENARGCSGGRLAFTPLPPEPVAPVVTARCLGAETGAGKTRSFERASAAASRSGFRVYGAFPRHEVSEQVVKNLRNRHGVAALSLRGRHAPDPEMPGRLMCWAPEAAKLAEEACLPVYDTVCAARDGSRCPHFGSCGYIQQRAAKPDLWNIQHSSLATPRPEHVEAPNGLVIDETLNVIPSVNETQRLGVDVLAHMPTEVENDPALSARLADMRSKLVKALRGSPEGHLARQTLTGARITAEGASGAARAERRRVRTFGMFPGMDPRQQAVVAKEAAKVNGETMAASGLWQEIAEFLRHDVPVSGRMKIVLDGKTKGAGVEWRSLKRIHDSWLTGPVLLTDATPVGRAYVEAALGRDVVVEVAPMLAVDRNPHGRIIQVVRAPTSTNKLGLKSDKPTADGRRNREGVHRYILREAARAWPRTVVVIASGKMEAWLRGHTDWLANVDFEHFGNVSGIDRWRKAATLIVVGRHGVPSRSLEADAGVLTGIPAQALPTGPRGEPWLQRVPGAIRLVDGSTHVVEREFHPDPSVEMLRFRSNEGETLQAIGRLRSVWRDGIEPWEVHILNDQPLPIEVDEVRQWADAAPGAWADLIPDGVLFENRADILKAWPGRFSEDQARGRVAETSGVSPIWDSNRGNPRSLRATFRRKGKAEVVAHLLPTGPRTAAAFDAWLIARGFEGVAEVVVEGEGRPVDRVLVSAVVRSMNENEHASPNDVWARVEARLGRPANATERAALPLAAMNEGDQQFVDRKVNDDGLPLDFGNERFEAA
ncbi:MULTISPECIES: bifunctional DNA primase/polymerase [unclassified Methylobacterium]|uniref:bifunctional DNA primase/polymerase n=1 Tax=unclassified Methylobacterium TaxID=2615210 RepID=UPI002269C8F8|nr:MULTISPECIES: bifunctional DNA primase/polymerase [unclassified Methylobacterium]